MRRLALILLLVAFSGPAARSAPRPGGRLEGRVLAAGAPVAGAGVDLYRLSGGLSAVALWSDDSEWVHPERELETPIPPGPPLARVEADAAGRFSFFGLAPGRYAVLATGLGGARGYRHPALHTADASADLTVELAGGGPHALAGTARLRDGRPFRGILVFWRGWPEWPETDTGVEGFVIPDAQGRFSASGLYRGLCRIAAVDPGTFRVDLGTVLLPRDAPLDLVVDERLMESRGIVLDPHGRPASGVLVLARGDGSDYGGWDDATVAAGARTDAAGRFCLSGPLAPEFRVVDPERWLPAAQMHGKSADGILLVVHPRPIVRGIVRSAADGMLLPCVPVVAVPAERSLEPARAVLTDAQGRFALAAPALEVTLA
ncbi:MAG: carboxypeptidase-like regulatory domain-containing protein, partial [Planctomycetes bacterium]|nr:carboxypeptidase-like regulatory domain-containing protein [Planctomycetota bacterium]